MTITSFTKTTARSLGEEATRELAALCAKHGLSVSYAGGSFDGGSFTMKVKFTTEAAQSDPTLSSEGRYYEMMREIEGLPPLGTVIIADGRRVKIIGYNSRAPKMPIMLEGEDGRRMKAAPSYVKRARVAA